MNPATETFPRVAPEALEEGATLPGGEGAAPAIPGLADLDETACAAEPRAGTLRIRWWILPVALLLCGAQAVLCQLFENRGTPTYLIATQISVIAFAFLALLGILVNPLLRLTRLVRPMNRAEMMALFAAMFVSGGIASFGLVNQLLPLIAAPHDAQWNVPQRGWQVHVIPHLNRHLYITDTAIIAKYREGFDTREGLWKKIPWRVWAKPAALWMVFVLACYLLFYSLSMLCYDSWARREKLVFPLARLPEDMVHADGASPGSLPAVLRSGAFWAGFLAMMALLSYNASCQAEWIRHLRPIRFGIEQGTLRQMLENSALRGIAEGGGHHLQLTIFFVAVGVAFLLPLEISFSLWGYHLLGLGMVMVAIWSAVGASSRAFPADWLSRGNFLTSLGAGGLMTFSLILLLKLLPDRWAAVKDVRGGASAGPSVLGRAQLSRIAHWGGLVLLYGGAAASGWFYGAGTSAGWRLAVVGLVLVVAGGAHAFVSALLMPRLLARYERRTGSRLDLRRVDDHLIGWAGLLFLVSLAVAVGWLVWSGIPTLWGCVFVASLVLLTVGYMRVVAEGGVYWFQMYGASPFHLAGIFGASVVPGRVLAALVPIYSVLFLDTKTFMAPAVISSFKMAEETRAARRRYHVVVVLSVLFTVVVASVALLYLAYEIGANRSGPWFFTDGPTRLLDHAKTLASSAPGEASPAAGIGFFVAIGAAWVLFSVAMRRKFFWWLHPIGFVMLTNPLMSTLWFSFFLGWLCKALAVKYGGRHMYARVRPFFVGLIFGQIMACFLWSVLAHVLHLEHVKIDINNV